MKYMGSKTKLIAAGLGEVITNELDGKRRFIDLFSGSGSVVNHVARSHAIATVAVDLQNYSKILADAVISRVKPLEFSDVCTPWFTRAHKQFRTDVNSAEAELVSLYSDTLDRFPEYVEKNRSISDKSSTAFVKAYGGHYFSAHQVHVILALRKTLPENEPERSVCLAALLDATSNAAASPGHTAQPFKADTGAAKFLRESWEKDIWKLTRQALIRICPLFALRRGESLVSDATEWAQNACQDDLVFLDPPYSGVHYSRFYHVLESLVTGTHFEPEGTGRYPASSLRPRSQYSMKGLSISTFGCLIDSLSSSTVILTYPEGSTSNGLSGQDAEEKCRANFYVTKHVVKGDFSTLGGNNDHRSARQRSAEMILVCHPK